MPADGSKGLLLGFAIQSSYYEGLRLVACIELGEFPPAAGLDLGDAAVSKPAERLDDIL